MKSKKEIILETVEYYKNNPRSIKEGHCVYNGPNGSKCAMGRLIKDDAIEDIDENQSATNIVINSPDIIKEEYSGYQPEFYQDLQLFHDNWCNNKKDFRKNWETINGENNLTELGEERVKELLEKYAD